MSGEDRDHIEPVAALKALMEEEASRKYGTDPTATTASRSMTIANLTGEDVEVRVAFPSRRVEPTAFPPMGWTGAEEVGIGPSRSRGFDEAISAYLEWSLRTFPTSTPASVAAHLRKEVKELNDSPESAEELADIVMLAFHSAARQGIDLTAAIDQKLAVLKTRTWQSPNEEGFQEHVKENP